MTLSMTHAHTHSYFSGRVNLSIHQTQKSKREKERTREGGGRNEGTGKMSRGGLAGGLCLRIRGLARQGAVSCMHTQLYHMHTGRCLACPRDKPHSKATVASHSLPIDPREPHGSLLFHCSPSAGDSGWSLLLCNMHTRLLWVSLSLIGSWGTEDTHTPSFLPGVLKTWHSLDIS